MAMTIRQSGAFRTEPKWSIIHLPLLLGKKLHSLDHSSYPLLNDLLKGEKEKNFSSNKEETAP